MEIVEKRPNNYNLAAITTGIVEMLWVNFSGADAEPRIGRKIEFSVWHIVGVNLIFQTQTPININRYPAIFLFAPILIYPVVGANISKLAHIKIRRIAGANPRRNTI